MVLHVLEILFNIDWRQYAVKTGKKLCFFSSFFFLHNWGKAIRDWPWTSLLHLLQVEKGGFGCSNNAADLAWHCQEGRISNTSSAWSPRARSHRSAVHIRLFTSISSEECVCFPSLAKIQMLEDALPKMSARVPPKCPAGSQNHPQKVKGQPQRWKCSYVCSLTWSWYRWLDISHNSDTGHGS